jgi:hypothetical protein
MNDAQKTVNLLERIEFQLEAILVELRMARQERGAALHVSPNSQHDDMQELGAAPSALDTRRRQSMEDPDDNF